MIIRQTVSTRVGKIIQHRGRNYIIKRPLWWKVAITRGKEEWKTALQPWKYWYYELELIKNESTNTEVNKQSTGQQEIPPGS